MRSITQLLAGGIVCCALPSSAGAEPLTPVRFRQILAMAKAYAADRTLIFYCIRNNAEMLPFSYLVIHVETEEALNKLRATGSEAKQNAECKAKNVEQNYFTFSGPLVTPLGKRAPFDSLSR